MKKHTPGKLVHFHGQATVLSSEETGAEGKVRLLLNCDSPSAYVSRQEAEANAARVRACWNACEGIEDPAKLIEAMRTLLKRRARPVHQEPWMAVDRDALAELAEMLGVPGAFSKASKP